MSSNWYGEDGTNGTCNVHNGSPNVTFSAANLLTNNAATQGDGFKGPDGVSYGISAVTGDNAITLNKNYGGADNAAGAWAIIPLLGGRSVALTKLVSTLLNSGSYSSMAALVPNLGDFAQCTGTGPTTWSNRSAAQVLVSLLNAAGEVNVASAANCDIGAQTSAKLSITGATGITSFNPAAGTMTPNAVRFLRFTGAVTLTASANLILPGLSNSQTMTTAAGDTAIFLSDNSNPPIWRCWHYTRASGAGVLTSLSLSGALTYGGVTLSNSVTGIGSMVLGASPTLTGTVTVSGVAATPNTGLLLSGTTTARNLLGITNAGGSALFGVESSAGNSTFIGGSAYATVLGTNNATQLQFATSGTVAATVDANQNVMVGTTASLSGRFQSVIATGVAAVFQNNVASSYYTTQIWNAATTGVRNLIGFYTDSGALNGSITANGSSVTYNTTSARDLKMGAQLLDVSAMFDGPSIMYRGKWIAQPDLDWVGGIADEMATLVPEGYLPSTTPDLAPHQDGYVPDQFDYTKWVPYLVAEAFRARAAEKAAQQQIETLTASLSAIQARLTAAGIA